MKAVILAFVFAFILFVSRTAAAPVITAVSPKSGPRVGGTTVTFTGTELDASTTITINGVAVASITSQTPTSLVVVTGNSNPVSNGNGPVLIGGVATGGSYTYIDAAEFEGVVSTTVPISFGDYINADLSSYTTVRVWINAAPGVTVTQFNGDPLGVTFPVMVSDLVRGRVQVTFPASAGRTNGAIDFTIRGDGVDVETNVVNVLAIAASCAVTSLEPPVGVSFVSPPGPSAFTVTYTSGTQTFDFAITMAYLRDNAIVNIDFASDFAPNTHGIRNNLATTQCNNRPALSSGTYPIHDLFHSAPTAQFPNALDGTLYKAYPAAQLPWVQAATACNTVQYTASFTFADLVACNTYASTPAVTVTAGVGTITYAGSLFVDVLQPVDPESESTAFDLSRFEYPFSFQFNSQVEAISTFTSTNNLRVNVISTTVANSNPRILTIVIQTSATLSADSTLTAVSVTGLFGGAATITTASTPTCAGGILTTCVQQWTYTSTTAWSNSYNGQYQVVWSSSSGSVTSTLNIGAILTTPTDETNLDLATIALTFYGSLTDVQAGTPVHTGSYFNQDRLYMRADMNIAGGSAANFDLHINDLYICWDDNPLYKIVLPSGCTDASLPSDQVIKLVDSDLAVTATDPAQKFNAALVAIANNAAGVAWDVSPLATPNLGGLTFYVHVVATIEQNTKRQVVHMTSRVSSDPKASLGTFTIQNDVDMLDGSDATRLISDVPVWLTTAFY